MSPERTQSKESPDRQTWEEKIRTLEERLEVDLTPQEEKRTVEELGALKTARDFGFDADALEQALNEAEDITLEKKLTAALTIIKEAGAVEAASRIPEPIINDAEAAAGTGTTPKPTAPEIAKPDWEATRKAAETTPAEQKELAGILKEEERGLNLGREITKKDIADLWHKLSQKNFLGTRLIDLAGGAGIGFLVRNATRHGLGFFTGGAGYALGALSGFAAGTATGAYSAYRKEKRREISRDEIVEKARLTEGERKEKFDAYLKLVELAEANPDSPEISAEKTRLYQELRKEFGVRRSKIIKGAMYGALTGAVGGYIGTWIADYFSGTGGGSKVAENLAEARKAAKAAGGEALRQQMEAQLMEHGRVIKAGLAGLDAREFTAFTRKGEGATHLARKLISDYINQHQALGDKGFKFSKAQLVYAEDWLQKAIFPGVGPQLGESLKVDGSLMARALAKAADLSPAEIDNLNKNWVGKISEKTWKSIFDFKNVYSADNDFAAAIFDEAKRKSAAAGKRAAEELGRAAARPPSPQAAEAAGSWFRSVFNKYGPPIIMVGAAAGGVYGILRAIRRMHVALDRRASRRAEKETGEQEGPEIPGAEQPRPVANIEEQRRAEEEIQRAEEVRFEAQRSEKEREEHKKKLAADPLITLLHEGGISIEPEDGFRYEIPSKESIAARKGPSMSFDNYPDFRQYLEGLTPEERTIAERFRTTIGLGENAKKYPTLGIWASPNFWDKLKANPELKRKFDELSPKITQGYIEDAYHGLPEKEDPEIAVGSLMDELNKRFRATYFSFYRNREIPAEEEMEALHKLSRVLEKIPTEELPATGFMFAIGKRGVYSNRSLGKVVEVDPSLSEEEMRRYIMEAVETLKTL